VSIHIPASGATHPGLVSQRHGTTYDTTTRVANGGEKRTVSISPAARQLSSLQSGNADVDLERVQALRAAIASGAFTVDTGCIADGLIASARELLGGEPSA